MDSLPVSFNSGFSSFPVVSCHDAPYEEVYQLALKTVASLNWQNDALMQFMEEMKTIESEQQRVAKIFNYFATVEDLLSVMCGIALEEHAEPKVIYLILEQFGSVMRSRAVRSGYENLQGTELFIYYALYHQVSLAVLKQFKEVGCRFDLPIPDYENEGDHICSALEHGASVEVIQFLLEAGAKVNARGITLQVAEEHHASEEIVSLLKKWMEKPSLGELKV